MDTGEPRKTTQTLANDTEAYCSYNKNIADIDNRRELSPFVNPHAKYYAKTKDSKGNLIKCQFESSFYKEIGYPDGLENVSY